MSTVVNAAFWRRNAGRRTRGQAISSMCVQGLCFDLPFEQITAAMVLSHPKAPPATEGWTLQGFCMPRPKRGGAR